jgi:hypothetical protein
VSTRKKWVLSIVVGTAVFLVGKIIEFLEFVAVSYSPAETATRISLWKELAVHHIRGAIVLIVVALAVAILTFVLGRV